MKSAELSGVFPVVPTPFERGGEVDLVGLRAVLERLLARGVEGVMLLGSGGELGFLTEAERETVVKAAVSRLEGAFVIAGVAKFGTVEAVDEAKRLEGAGARALLVALPQYFETPVSSVIRHYAAVAEAVAIPVLYYHFPIVFGLKLRPKEMAELFARVPLAGIKESGLSTPELHAHVREVDRSISAFTGQSFNLLPALDAGAVGAICPVPTLLPTTARELVEAFRSGDRKTAADLQARLFRALPMISGGGLPAKVAEVGLKVGLRTGAPLPQKPAAAHAGVKEALRVLGIIECADVRDPQPPISAAQKAAVAALAPKVCEI